MADDAEIQRVSVERDVNLGRLAGRLSFVRFGLNEAGCRLARTPDVFIKGAVEHDRRPRFDSNDRPAAVCRRELLDGRG